MNVDPTCPEPNAAWWKRSASGAMPCENRCVSDPTALTSGCAVTIRCSQNVPLRREPTLKIIRPRSGDSARLTRTPFPSAGH